MKELLIANYYQDGRLAEYINITEVSDCDGTPGIEFGADPGALFGAEFNLSSQLLSLLFSFELPF